MNKCYLSTEGRRSRSLVCITPAGYMKSYNISFQIVRKNYAPFEQGKQIRRKYL